MERDVAMGRGQFPNRVKSNKPYGRGLLTLNGTDPLPTAPDLCTVGLCTNCIEVVDLCTNCIEVSDFSSIIV